MRILLLLAAIQIASSGVEATTQHPAFIPYSNGTLGFRAAFPGKPESFDLDLADVQIRSFQSTDTRTKAKYSIFFNLHNNKFLDRAAVDSYLDHFTDRMPDTIGLTLSRKQKLVFRGFPAILYETSAGELATRSIIFVFDGDSIRLSVLYPKTAFREPPRWQEFVESFVLLPLEPALSSSPFPDSVSGLSLQSPEGWQQRTSKNPNIRLMFFNKSGHSVVISVEKAQAYSCKALEEELYQAGSVSTGDIQIWEQRARWIKVTALNPSAGIRMSTIYFCGSVANRVLVVAGSSPEYAFFRSEKIFRAVAGSAQLAK